MVVVLAPALVLAPMAAWAAGDHVVKPAKTTAHHKAGTAAKDSAAGAAKAVSAAAGRGAQLVAVLVPGAGAPRLRGPPRSGTPACP